MKIKAVEKNKKQYLALLLLADEQESMIDRYLERGRMYALDDGGVKAVCVVTDEGNGVLEIKNIAVDAEYQRRGFGRALVSFVEENTAVRFTRCESARATAPQPCPFTKNAASSVPLSSGISLRIITTARYTTAASDLRICWCLKRKYSSRATFRR